MIIVKEQIEELNKNIRQLELKLSVIGNKSISIMSYKDKQDYYNTRYDYIELLQLRNKISNLEVIENNSDIIGLGSIFNASIESNTIKDTSNYIVSDCDIKVPGYVIINLDAPFTKAVIGKSENDEFSYNVGFETINGKINKIIKKEEKVYRLEK